MSAEILALPRVTRLNTAVLVEDLSQEALDFLEHLLFEGGDLEHHSQFSGVIQFPTKVIKHQPLLEQSADKGGVCKTHIGGKG